MLKKLILFTTICVFIFIPLAKVGATEVYIQVVIGTFMEPDGSDADFTFGLTMKLYTEADQLNPIAIKTITEAVAGSGGIVYFDNPVDIVDGGDYIINIETNYCDYPDDYNWDGAYEYCWYKGTGGQNCNQACALHGGTYSSDTDGLCAEQDNNAIIANYIIYESGFSSGCGWTDYSCPAGFKPYTGSPYAYCSYCITPPVSSVCGVDMSGDPDFIPVCVCKSKGQLLSFSFPFTAILP